MSQYAVDDVISGTLTFSSVEEFDDIFDSNLHTASTDRALSGRHKIDFNVPESIGTYVFLCPQDDRKIKEKAIRHLNNVKRLISFCGDEDIELSVMTPDVGRFSLLPKNVEPAKLFDFIDDNMKMTRHIKNYCVTWIFRCAETACPEDWKPRVRRIGNRFQQTVLEALCA